MSDYYCPHCGADDEKYDGLFPYHPLSEMRRFIDYIVENN
jgi:hypothetical protein